MKEWWSPAELAELNLPGLPTRRTALSAKADTDNWRKPDQEYPENLKGTWRKREEGRGGGYEYHYSLLDEPARKALMASQLPVVDVPENLQKELKADPDNNQLSDIAAEARDARLALLGIADRYRETGNLTQSKADEYFCLRYNTRSLDVADWIGRQVKSLTSRTLRNWRKALREGASSRLGVDRGGARRGSGVLEDNDVKTYILALMIKQPHLSADMLRDIVIGHYGEEFESIDNETGEVTRISMPSIRTFQRTLKTLKADNEALIAYKTNPDKFNSKYKISGTNSYSWVTEPNQLWQIDASPADVLTLDGRMTVYVVIDIATRRFLVYVTKTPRSEAVQLLMRRAILAWGVPKQVTTDNGSDFVAVTTERLFISLDIKVKRSKAFSPWQKGHVERAIKTLQHGLMPLLPGFIGHNVAERKAIESRRAFAQRLGTTDEKAFSVELTANELQVHCDTWCSSKYMHKEHSGLKGKTPFEALSNSDYTIKTVDERALDVLLMPAADGLTRTVTKLGVRINHLHYQCPTVLPGRSVFVRLDPADMGYVYLFNDEGTEFLGHAVNYIAAGINPKEAMQIAREERAQVLSDALAPINKKLREISKGPSLIDLALRKKAEKAGKLVSLPRPKVDYSTPHIEAALQVVAETKPDQLSPEAQALHAGVVAAVEATQNIVTLPEAPAVRFNRAEKLEKRIVAGEEVSTKDALWLGGYQKSVEYKSRKAIAELELQMTRPQS